MQAFFSRVPMEQSQAAFTDTMRNLMGCLRDIGDVIAGSYLLALEIEHDVATLALAHKRFPELNASITKFSDIVAEIKLVEAKVDNNKKNKKAISRTTLLMHCALFFFGLGSCRCRPQVHSRTNLPKASRDVDHYCDFSSRESHSFGSTWVLHAGSGLDASVDRV